MEILVCVKQVPGTTNVEIDPVTSVLKRDGVASKLNPYDLFAVETGLRLVENSENGRMRAISMGPPQAKAVVVETIAMGAESGVLVTDRRFGGADVLATAYTLSQAVLAQGKVDLVLCGKQTTDGDTAQVGAEMAEFLGWPHANNVLEVSPDGEGFVKVRVDIDSCIIVQRMPLPCVLCIEGDVNTPRLPSYKRKKTLADDCVTMMTLDDFEDKDVNHYGLNGSPTKVERIFPPEKNDEKELLSGSANEMATQLVKILRENRLV